jgi:hypothetical protein
MQEHRLFKSTTMTGTAVGKTAVPFPFMPDRFIRKERGFGKSGENIPVTIDPARGMLARAHNICLRLR